MSSNTESMVIFASLSLISEWLLAKSPLWCVFGSVSQISFKECLGATALDFYLVLVTLFSSSIKHITNNSLLKNYNGQAIYCSILTILNYRYRFRSRVLSWGNQGSTETGSSIFHSSQSLSLRQCSADIAPKCTIHWHLAHSISVKLDSQGTQPDLWINYFSLKGRQITRQMNLDILFLISIPSVPFRLLI